VPNVTWDNVGALEDVRRDLIISIMEPIKRPYLFQTLGIASPAGVLLYGPPGCGKTMLAKGIANAASMLVSKCLVAGWHSPG
jgi:ribosome biogenesis ATPase